MAGGQRPDYPRRDDEDYETQLASQRTGTGPAASRMLRGGATLAVVGAAVGALLGVVVAAIAGLSLLWGAVIPIVPGAAVGFLLGSALLPAVDPEVAEDAHRAPVLNVDEDPKDLDERLDGLGEVHDEGE